MADPAVSATTSIDCPTATEAAPETVSYTHLDVYKRQAHAFNCPSG